MIDIIVDNFHYIRTKGLSNKCGGYELEVFINSLNLTDECKNFTKVIINYLISGNKIKSGETISYGYWLTKAIISDEKYITFWEYEPDVSKFIFGIDNTLIYWKTQNEICQKANAIFAPPRPDQMIVISDGVYEGDLVEAVRYPSPDHMSGWWFTTERYNGNINTLKTVHAHHVSSQRPDLAKYFALPYGYRFDTSNESVWFDEEVANSRP